MYYFATADNLLTNIKGHYYEWRFGNIYYEKQGKGTPILLIHDTAINSSSYEWNGIIKKLAERNTVYTIDLLGCGRSDKPNLTYTNYLYVQMISDFIKHIVGEKCDVIATGKSSSFTLMTCANGEDMIKQVVLINPENILDLSKIPTKKTKTLRFIINIPIIGTLLYNLLNMRRTLEKTFRTNYFYSENKIKSQDIKIYYESAYIKRFKSKYLFSSIIGRYTNVNILHGLSNINNSIFIITGNNNPDNQTIAEQYKEYIPSIEIISLENAKYLPHLESPEIFLEQISFIFDSES